MSDDLRDHIENEIDPNSLPGRGDFPTDMLDAMPPAVRTWFIEHYASVLVMGFSAETGNLSVQVHADNTMARYGLYEAMRRELVYNDEHRPVRVIDDEPDDEADYS